MILCGFVVAEIVEKARFFRAFSIVGVTGLSVVIAYTNDICSIPLSSSQRAAPAAGMFLGLFSASVCVPTVY